MKREGKGERAGQDRAGERNGTEREAHSGRALECDQPEQHVEQVGGQVGERLPPRAEHSGALPPHAFHERARVTLIVCTTEHTAQHLYATHTVMYIITQHLYCISVGVHYVNVNRK